MTRTQRAVLDRNFSLARPPSGVCHIRAYDDDNALDGGVGDRLHQVVNHWTAAHRMHHLGQRRAHPGSFAGGKDDGGDFWGVHLGLAHHVGRRDDATRASRHQVTKSYRILQPIRVSPPTDVTSRVSWSDRPIRLSAPRRLDLPDRQTYYDRQRARSSVVEHYVHIVGVAGSIPAAPTMQPTSSLLIEAEWPV